MPAVTYCDGVGYAASCLVLGTFCMRNMAALRAVAICSNVMFIAYGWLAHIEPVLLLHLVLLPTNSWRLAQVLARRRVRPGWRGMIGLAHLTDRATLRARPGSGEG